MASAIDATKPVAGAPTTSSVRDNFSFAETEINELQRATEDAVTAGGTADALTANFTTDVVLAEGITIVVLAASANATTTPTLDADSTGAKTIVKNSGAALVAGDIGGDRHYLILKYDATNTVWVLMNPVSADELGGESSAYHLSRTNHTGAQAQSTITDLTTDLGNKVETSVITISTSDPSGGSDGDLWFKYVP